MKKLLIGMLFITGLLCSCNEKHANMSVTLESFSELCDPTYTISPELLNDNILRLVMRDRGNGAADIHARRHYMDNKGLVWVTRDGVSSKADTLLAFLADLDTIGLSREKFLYTSINNDLKRARDIDFAKDKESPYNINKVYARLEFHLTKAFLRYTEGQRFGFVNPYNAFNRLDVRDSDSVRVSYRSLYGAPTRLPDKKFVETAFKVMAEDGQSVGNFLRASQPENPLYAYFVEKLRYVRTIGERRLLLCNIERSRWGNGDYPQKHSKYLVVNIPSLHLFAKNGDEYLVMRVGLGSLETKTPILSSVVKRMDFNPQWIIPKSIVKKSVCQHAGSIGYFESHNYFVRERSTGKTVAPEKTTADMLMSSNYSVVQRGGEGNALGRVIFRFDNDYSIFLHDTSNPGVFTRNDRSVSHGCVRVEKPYELAVFMLAEKDEDIMGKIRYSMTTKYREGASADYEAEAIDKSKMLRSLKVEPKVPIYITYYTLYPDRNGNLMHYSDIYGYDAVIYRLLQPYLE